MALRILSRAGAARCPLSVKSIAASPRFYSTPAATTPEDPKLKQRPDPKEVALNLIDGLPGNNYISKTGYITAGTGLLTYLISKEIYIVNEETIVAGCFVGLMFHLVTSFRKPYNDATEAREKHIKDILVNARASHKHVIQERISEVGQMSDIVDVTKNLFEMSKDMAQLEAKAFVLQQEAAVANEVKGVLDSWVRHEAAVRHREQAEVAQTVMERARKSLMDARVQDQILQQALVDVDRLVATK